MRKLTPWFDERVKPIHIGWYETIVYKHGPHIHPRIIHTERSMTWWNGEFWTYFRSHPSDLESGNICGMQCRDWRGLAKPAAEQPTAA